MSYISTMAVNDGIIMLADRRVGNIKSGERPLFKRKLFTTGNIGVCFLSHYCTKDPFLSIEQFCEHKHFNGPMEAAEGIHKHIRTDLTESVGTMCVIQIAGYNKSDNKPAVYTIDYRQGEEIIGKFGNETCKYRGDRGFFHFGCADGYIEQYAEMINKSEFIRICSLQEAADWSVLMHSFGKGMIRYMSLRDDISDEIDVIAITPEGIRWLRKPELEVAI
jgi:hypothetical protein